MFSGRQWLTILLAGGTAAFAFMMALSGSFGGMFLSNFTQLPLFLAGLSLITITVLPQFPLLVLTSSLGNVDPGPVIGGTLGAIFLGAAYLVYLGIQYLRGAHGSRAPVTATARAHGRIFTESILVEVLNPKTALFFIAFLPQFVDVSRGPPAPQILLLGVIVTLSAIPCDLLVAWVSGRAARAIAAVPTTPPAGPERMACAPVHSSVVLRPPSERM